MIKHNFCNYNTYIPFFFRAIFIKLKSWSYSPESPTTSTSVIMASIAWDCLKKMEKFASDMKWRILPKHAWYYFQLAIIQSGQARTIMLNIFACKTNFYWECIIFIQMHGILKFHTNQFIFQFANAPVRAFDLHGRFFPIYFST